MAGEPGLTGPVGEPVGGQKAAAAWNRMLRVIVKDAPEQLRRAQASRKRLAGRRR